MIQFNINSEIGRLRAVLIHEPGPEVENMSPATAERALYSDILNLSVASREYEQLSGILNRYTQTYQVLDLLSAILEKDEVKEELVKKICKNEGVPETVNDLLQLNSGGISPANIATAEGHDLPQKLWGSGFCEN